MSVLIAATSSAQPPTTPGTVMRCLQLAFLADRARDARGFARPPLADRRDVVEGVGDLAVDAGQVRRQADREVAVAQRQQRRQEGFRKRVGRPGVGRIPVRVEGRSLAALGFHFLWPRADYLIRASKNDRSPLSWISFSRFSQRERKFATTSAKVDPLGGGEWGRTEVGGWRLGLAGLGAGNSGLGVTSRPRVSERPARRAGRSRESRARRL